MITICCVSRFKNDFVKMGFDEYYKRLQKYYTMSLLELKDERVSKDEDAVKLIETQRVLKSTEGMYRIFLDPLGKEYSSVTFAAHMKKLLLEQQHIAFCVGGALGFSEEGRKHADEVISLSKMTFPHQLVRILLIEQIYRSCMINNGVSYHK
ncbi:23S rRNA (pseudouridine(1915)-N(3))-methyltransferase RlmH [Candidatus Woesearchaeota archaeon]|nr:23S rRNA (pseudouridine(1915)-N(3))-methyltransferase RlmH [Candidatus Woesearchaeota archaeon]